MAGLREKVDPTGKVDQRHWGLERQKVRSKLMADPKVMVGWTQTVESKVMAASTAMAESKQMAASTATAESTPMAALKRRVS